MAFYEQAKKIKLFQFGAEWDAFSDLVQENGGEITVELEQIQVEIEAIEAQKIDNCVAYLKTIEAQIAGAEKLAQEIIDNAKKLENKKESFKKYMLWCLQKSGKSELKGNAFKLKPKKGSFSVHIKNENLVPAFYLEEKREIKINKKSIAEAFKSGSHVDGCEYVQGETTLSISSGV